MSITEVRNKFHTLIDTVENPELLQRFLDLMKQTTQKGNKSLLDSLTEADRDDVLKSYEESLDEANLVANEDVIHKYKKWLKK